MRKYKGSRIAYSIDRDFQKTELGKEIAQFRDNYCNRCINHDTKLCEIRRTVDNKLKCIYYEVKNENCIK